MYYVNIDWIQYLHQFWFVLVAAGMPNLERKMWILKLCGFIHRNITKKNTVLYYTLIILSTYSWRYKTAIILNVNNIVKMFLVADKLILISDNVIKDK